PAWACLAFTGTSKRRTDDASFRRKEIAPLRCRGFDGGPPPRDGRRGAGSVGNRIRRRGRRERAVDTRSAAYRLDGSGRRAAPGVAPRVAAGPGCGDAR